MQNYKTALVKAVQNNTVEYFSQPLGEKLEGEFLHGFYNHNSYSVDVHVDVIDGDDEYNYSMFLKGDSFTPFIFSLLKNPKFNFHVDKNITAKCSLNLDDRKRYLENLVKNKMDFGYFDYKYALSFNLETFIKENSDDYLLIVDKGEARLMACFNSEKRLNEFIETQKHHVLSGEEEIRKKFEEINNISSNRFTKNEYQESLEKEISSLRDLVIKMKKDEI
jgi:hypothetical protein